MSYRYCGVAAFPGVGPPLYFPAMRIEVEQKFPVADLDQIRSALVALGAEVSPPKTEADTYYAHPARNFAQTDEALRIRRAGGHGFLTYKGPKLDATTKTRREIDLPLFSEPEAGDAWAGLLEALGFSPVEEVHKQRRKAFVSWQGRRIEVSLDEVRQVGTFVELELVTTDEDVEAAKKCIASLAERLGLSGSERKSYLELLLERTGKGRE
jgi:adenylate cyclase, class 2